MTYYPRALGTIDPSNFNSTKFPGSCYATNKPTFDQFAFLQQQINRVSKMRGFPLIAIDGNIGPGTVAALMRIGGLTASAATCSMVAVQADLYGANTRFMADAIQAPAYVVPPRPVKPPSFFDPRTNQEVSPYPSGMFGDLSTPMVIAIGVAVLGAGYLLLSRPKQNPARRKNNPHRYWRRRRSR